MFYVTVRQPDRHRAMALATAIADQLQARFQELRNAKARSMIDELTNAVQLARQDLARSTARLAEIENQVGSDLAELRMLNESMSGESALRRMVVEVENQARQLRLSQKTNRQLLDLLRQCRSAPDRLVATPNRLLGSQPALRQLKEGLVAAQLSTSELLGRYTEEHPLVQAAREGERQIKANLHRELDHAVEGVEIDLQLDAERLAMLDQRRAELEAKLRRLARLRAAYANQLAETRNRTQLLEQAEQKLAEARMSQATAKAASLIGRLDDPETGANPVGPSRLAILLVGVTGGLISGFGLVFLRHPYAKPATMAPGPEGNGQPGTAAPPAVPGTVKKAFVELESLPEWN
ncbi:MAG TPA: hypothetical protein EYH34_10665 [Planctomycetes bacterium]|nr:hypothetical protein [Planctomycetota bacterium]